jgi:ribonucleoside-diphosphate reductase beta chain
MSVFSTTKTDFTKESMFFGAEPNLARYDVQKYPIFEKLTEKQIGFFWTPGEVDLSKDARDFKSLTKNEQFIFTQNLKYQILLDSVQGRSPNIALLPFISIPELETTVITWSFFETIHSRSYTHIIRNLYPNPGEVFDTILDNTMIVARAQTVTDKYDDFIEYANYYKLLGYGSHTITSDNKSKTITINEYTLKTKLYLTLASIYILEGIRFYVSFACSFAFGENSKMEGNSKLISLIARDEFVHLGITQNIIKNLPKEDDMFAKIIHECTDEVYAMFNDAADQEKEWAKYLFNDGSIIGLNEILLSQYVEYMTNKRLKALGFKSVFANISNPLQWTNKYLGSKDVQTAKQETENSSYLVGSVDTNVNTQLLSSFVL